jgi:type VI secretion system protein ImpK
MASDQRPENLALAFQELLTLGERLRSGRQVVTNAEVFRGQIWEAVKVAERDARSYGYPPEDIRLGIFAVIAFLDESILNLRQSVFADWPRQPLQEERYGHHTGGEIFFQNLQEILGRSDSPALADLLEVYDLCLLLGFAGGFSLGHRGDLCAIRQQTSEKISRIRRPSGQLSPEGTLPPGASAVSGGDPWIKSLILGAIGSFALAVVLFVIFNVFLNSGARSLSDFAGLG